MIGIIDNIGYYGPKPNFQRDAMTYDQMVAITNNQLDLGHIVYCTTEEYKGHYKFLGHTNSFSTSWEKVITTNSMPLHYNSNGTGIQSVQVTAEGTYAFAVGKQSEASGDYSVAEGYKNKAQGDYSVATGNTTIADGESSHSEGNATHASGKGSHAEGINTVATNDGEHAEGKFNKSNEGTISSVGIGTASNKRKNAEETLLNGVKFILGIGGYDGTNPGSAVDLASFVNNLDNTVSNQVFAIGYDPDNGDLYVIVDGSNSQFESAEIDQYNGDVVVNFNF